MNSITVTTEKELKMAIEDRCQEIIVIGELAKKITKAKKIKSLSKYALGLLGAACATAAVAVVAAPIAPPVGGVAMFVTSAETTAAAAATGLSIPVIITIATVGLSLVSILFDEYTHIEVGRDKIIFDRKRK